MKNESGRDEIGNDTARGLGVARMSDVARLAQVTTMTVSRALRTPEKVSSQTRERIEEAIRQSGFVPNFAARSLSSQHTAVIVALFPTMMNSVFSGTIDAISRYLTDHQYHLLLGQTDFDIHKEEALLAGFVGWRPAGIVTTGGTHTPRTLELLKIADCPIVEVWNLPEKPIDISVGFSNADAAYEMTSSLHSWGYRNIAFVYIDAPDNDRSLMRLQGYRRAVAEFGLPSDPLLEIQVPFGVHTGSEAMKHVLTNLPKVDAVFCASDTLAVGSLMQALRSGRRIPEDIAVAGFGDVDLAAELVPALTSVHVPRTEIGRRSAQILLEKIENRYTGTSIVDCGFSIIRRESA